VPSATVGFQSLTVDVGQERPIAILDDIAMSEMGIGRKEYVTHFSSFCVPIS
jgi:hypothetical protein